jgi:hypothetical protein
MIRRLQSFVKLSGIAQMRSHAEISCLKTAHLLSPRWFSPTHEKKPHEALALPVDMLVIEKEEGLQSVG